MKYVDLPIGRVACLNRSNTLELYKELFVHDIYGATGVSVKDGDVVIDVGANIGLFATWYIRQAKCLQKTRPTVHCFEPSPETFRVLTENHDPSLCSNLAVLDHVGTTDFTHYPHLPELSTAFPDAYRSDEMDAWRAYVGRMVAINWAGKWMPKFIRSMATKVILKYLFQNQVSTVECTTLERVLRNFDKVDLLKIDVEKSESRVLDGIGSEWWKIKQIIVESWGEPSLVQSIDATLKSRGFTVSWHDNPCFPELRTPLAFGRRST